MFGKAHQDHSLSYQHSNKLYQTENTIKKRRHSWLEELLLLLILKAQQIL